MKIKRKPKHLVKLPLNVNIWTRSLSFIRTIKNCKSQKYYKELLTVHQMTEKSQVRFLWFHNHVIFVFIVFCCLKNQRMAFFPYLLHDYSHSKCRIRTDAVRSGKLNKSLLILYYHLTKRILRLTRKVVYGDFLRS